MRTTAILWMGLLGCGSGEGPGCDGTDCVDEPSCGAGEVLADPDGQGPRCIPGDSSCFGPQDCGATDDPCCEHACREGADGRFACDPSCIGAPDGGYPTAPPECWDHDDCVKKYGAGSRCDPCPGFCTSTS